MYYYTLDAKGEPQIESCPHRWARWMENANLHVARDCINGSVVSTVFLAHAFDQTAPNLWETAVLGGALDQVKNRCNGSREHALAMHTEMIARILNSTAPVCPAECPPDCPQLKEKLNPQHPKEK